MATIWEWIRRIVSVGIWQFLSSIGLKALLGLILTLGVVIAVVILLVILGLSLLF